MGVSRQWEFAGDGGYWINGRLQAMGVRRGRCSLFLISQTGCAFLFWEGRLFSARLRGRYGMERCSVLGETIVALHF